MWNIKNRNMIKKYVTKQFKQFLPMIEKAVWHYSKKYHLEREDLEGQAFLIFCEAIKTFDKGKATFSTYLTNELQRLEGYSKKEFVKKYKDIIRIKKNNQRGYGKNISVNRIEVPEVFHYDIFDKVITRMDYELSLSDDAKEIVTYILSRKWEVLDNNWKPRFSYIQKMYLKKGWTRNRINVAWENIKIWWQSSDKDQFCLEV